MRLNDKTYNVIKYLATVVLPAVGTLYFALAQIWGLPYAEQVVGTITALVTFLGVCMKVSSVSYTGDGSVSISDDKWELNMDIPLEDIQAKKTITLSVQK